MKSVLASIKPKYCELIANGKKRFEIRKTRPKINAPFRCYIYETKAEYRALDGYKNIGLGKVIGEFVCDYVSWIKCLEEGIEMPVPLDIEKDCNLTIEELCQYIGIGKIGYAWHISDLVIYGEPNEVYEFYSACKNEAENDCSKCIDGGKQNCFALTRPPQSWCYVEELRELNGFRAKSI